MNVSDELTPIPLDDLKPYLSSYLAGGWRKDELILETVEVGSDRIIGTLRVVDFFLPTTGQFHLSVPVAFIWMAQLAIIFVCLEHKLPAKLGEVYLREVNIKCRRPVTRMNGISLTLVCRERRPVADGIMFYRGSFDIDGGAFVGTTSFVSPVSVPDKSQAHTQYEHT